MRDQMMAVVAHDLRNPLQAIAMGVASMQQLPMTDSERTRQLGIVQRTAANMSRLIDDLLDVTRLEADQFDIERAPLHIASLFAEISELFETAAREQGVVLSCAGAPDMPPVLADHRRLVQVLSNLVGNALRFTPRGGWISVEARSLEANVTVTVRDNGCGIAVEDLTHLFDRFWRGREKQSGAGLGLFIAKGIVEAHGGRIWAESEPGRGTAMHFTLPAAAEPIAARDAISR